MLLIRNGDWARQFFADIAQHATTEGLAQMRPIIEAELGPLQGGFFDTPIIVYLLKTQPKYLDRWHPHTALLPYPLAGAALLRPLYTTCQITTRASIVVRLGSALVLDYSYLCSKGRPHRGLSH